MGMVLIEISEELIKTVREREPALRRPDITQPPFPDQGGAITRFLEHRSDRDVPRLQRLSRRIGLACIPPDSRVPVVKASHQNTAGWRTNRRAGIKMGEA